jgi:hypothetical protein
VGCRAKNKAVGALKQVTHIQLLSRLGMGGVTPLLPLYAFMASKGHLFLAFTTHTQIRMDCASLRTMKRQTISKIWVKKHTRASTGVHLHVFRIHCEPWNLLRKPILSHPFHKDALLRPRQSVLRRDALSVATKAKTHVMKTTFFFV